MHVVASCLTAHNADKSERRQR